MSSTPYHPWVASLVGAARPGEGGVLLLDEAALSSAKASLDGLVEDERTLRGTHLVGLMAALHRAHGEDVAALVTQLAALAAELLVDPARLRDAFDRAGLSGGAAERLLGTAPSTKPLQRDPSVPGVLDVRLRRP